MGKPWYIEEGEGGSAQVTVIGFSPDVGYALGDSHEDCRIYKGVRPRATVVFVLGFWLLDLANNTVQGLARALLADLARSTQRDSANAILSLWMAVGNILGFSTGASGLWYKWLPFLATRACCEACANLKAAFLVAVIFLIFCTAITIVYAKETPFMVSREILDETQKEMTLVQDSSPLLEF